MICNVSRGKVTRGVVGSQGSDLYVFELSGTPERWEYKGKAQPHGPFLPADQQGYEHIPQEFYAALDRAWSDPNHHVEFPDPFLDDLEVAGS